MENILIPRNLEGRKEKLKQMNIKLLSQEVIDGELILDRSFMDIDAKFVKFQKVNGDIWLKDHQWVEIPEWLKDVEITGSFICGYNELISLKNCPQKIGGDFSCNYNRLLSLDGCPEHIGGGLFCHHNAIKLKLPENIKLNGTFYN